MKTVLIVTFCWLLNSLIITTIVDVIIMGAPCPYFSIKARKKSVLIEKANQIDFQDGSECSGFASAYVLRHWGVEEDGNRLYEAMPNKLRSGVVCPKGIRKLLSRYGFKAKYCTGNLTAVMNEVSKGNPVIVMIRAWAGKGWLHYVPVVGYDEHYVYVAESLRELVNSEGQCFNRKVETREFLRLWNTSMWYVPLYRNTFFTVSR